jgi:hypothetical protein
MLRRILLADIECMMLIERLGLAVEGEVRVVAIGRIKRNPYTSLGGVRGTPG